MDHAADQSGVAAFESAIDGVEPTRKKVAPLGRLRRPEPQRRLRGLEREGVDGADEGRGGDDERELAVELPRQSRQKGGGNEHRHQDERDAKDWTCEFVHRAGRRVAAGDSLLNIARDALDDDDCVVDHDADREHDCEQSGKIDREAKRRHRRERADQRHRHGRRWHEHRPPVLKEDEDDDKHQDRRLDQGLVDFGDRGLHEFRRVVGHDIVEPLREGSWRARPFSPGPRWRPQSRWRRAGARPRCRRRAGRRD